MEEFGVVHMSIDEYNILMGYKETIEILEENNAIDWDKAAGAILSSKYKDIE